MALSQGFDARKVEPSNNEPIPADTYLMAISEAQVNQNSKKNGHIMSLTFDVLEGDHTGRKVFHNLNIDNPNATAQEIAERDLSAICHATGQFQIADMKNPVELKDLPLMVRVGIEDARGDYDARNIARSFKAAEDGVAASAPVAAPSAPSKPAAKKAAPAKPTAKKAPGKPKPPAKPKSPEPAQPEGTYPTIEAAIADGWAVHPEDSEWVFKGDKVVELSSVVVAPVVPGDSDGSKPEWAADAAEDTQAAPAVAESTEEAPWKKK